MDTMKIDADELLQWLKDQTVFEENEERYNRKLMERLREELRTIHNTVLREEGRISLQFVDNRDQPTEQYPCNPNGSPLGIAGLCSADGRVTALMPHPERVFRTVQLSWHPAGLGEDSPWMRLFRNARAFVA